VDDAAVREAVADAMAAKYGLLDDLLGALLRDESEVLPVRLDPVASRDR
jgi:hypothetical protein